MNTKTKVDIRNVLAGVGAGFLVIVLSVFAFTTFRDSGALGAAAIKGSNLNKNKKLSFDAQLFFKKTEIPFTGKKFNFTVRDDTRGIYLAPFSLVGDGKETEIVVPGGYKYTITEQSNNNGDRYETRFLCGILGGTNYRDVSGKSVTLTPSPNENTNIHCSVTNKCPSGVFCSLEEVKQLPKIFTP